MPTSTHPAASWLHRAFADGRTDRDLLAAFTAGDEPAFAELVRRHGPMVLGVCTRVLGNPDDAEDAYQSTFLALAQKAAHKDWRESLSGWLHDVAWRTANAARLRLARQRRREQRVPERSSTEADHELPEIFDQEIRQLPIAIREAVLCCYFQGLTRRQAADKLGCSLRTLERRLEQGRRRLRERLEARGEPVPMLLVGPALSLSSCLGRWWLLVGLLVVTGVGLAALSPSRLPEPAVVAKVAAPPRPEVPLPRGALARLGETRFRHGSSVAHLALSPDGKVVATSGEMRGLCLWDAATGRLVRDFSNDWPGAFASAFSPDGKRIVLVDPGVHPQIRDVATGKLVHWLTREKTRGSFHDSIAWSDNGKWVALGGDPVSVWDADSGKLLYNLKLKSERYTQIAFAPGSKLLATATAAGVHLWDPVTGLERHRLPMDGKSILSLAFSPDGKHLAFGESRREIYLWATDGKSELRVLRKADLGPGFSTLAFAPDGRTLATGWVDGSILLVDVPSGKDVRRWPAHPAMVGTLLFGADGKTLYSGAHASSAVRRWDPATGSEISPHQNPGGPINRLRFLPDDKTLVCMDVGQRVVRWDLATHTAKATTFPFEQRSSARDLSPDGKYVVRASGDSKAIRKDFRGNQAIFLSLFGYLNSGWGLSRSGLARRSMR